MSNLFATWMREPFIGGYIETNEGTGASKIVFNAGVTWHVESRECITPRQFGWAVRYDNLTYLLDREGRMTGTHIAEKYTGPVTLSVGKSSENGCGGQPLVLRFWGCAADYANEAERCADRRVAESIAEDETPPVGGIVDVG